MTPREIEARAAEVQSRIFRRFEGVAAELAELHHFREAYIDARLEDVESPGRRARELVRREFKPSGAIPADLDPVNVDRLLALLGRVRLAYLAYHANGRRADEGHPTDHASNF